MTNSCGHPGLDRLHRDRDPRQTAPDWSLATPAMVPVVSWAAAVPAMPDHRSPAAMANARIAHPILLRIILDSPRLITCPRRAYHYDDFAPVPILKRGDPVPLYHQLKIALLREIEGGRWRPGDRIPTEDALITRFKSARSPYARRFATSRKWDTSVASRDEAPSCRDRRSKKGRASSRASPVKCGTTASMPHPRSSSKASSPCPPRSPSASSSLEGSPVFRLRRLRMADGEPMGLQTAFIAMALVPRIDEVSFTDASLYEVLGVTVRAVSGRRAGDAPGRAGR